MRSGAADCVLVIGFEQMSPGSIKSVWSDRPSPMGLSTAMMEVSSQVGQTAVVSQADHVQETRGKHDSPRNAQYFANAGREYMEKYALRRDVARSRRTDFARYGARAEDFAEIARISHEHSQRNPYAQFRQKYSLEEILKSPMIHAPLTKLQCSPTSDGAGAAVIVSERFLKSRPQLRSQAILMAGQALMTDSPRLYSKSAMDLVGFDMTKRAVEQAYKEAGVGPKDISVCELHDCFSANELILLEGLGFSEPGKAHEMVRNGDITYGGKGPIINPSGGLISKGHPLGATGLAQCAELCWQLRGWANNRLVEAEVALQHNLGLGGAVVVTIYRRADGKKNRKVPDSEVVRTSAFTYNPATEARHPSLEDADKVRSKTTRNDYALGDTQAKIQARL